MRFSAGACATIDPAYDRARRAPPGGGASGAANRRSPFGRHRPPAGVHPEIFPPRHAGDRHVALSMRCALPTSVLAAVVIAAVLPATAAAACASSDTSLSSLDAATAKGALLCAVNDRRAAQRLAAYGADRALTQAAQGHDDAMVSHDFFDHASPGGATLIDRVRATGWIPSAGSYALGEAIAWAGAPLDTATQMVAQWMTSPPHRAILLDDHYRKAGLGVARGVPVGPDMPGTTIVLDVGVRTRAPAASSRSGHQARV